MEEALMELCLAGVSVRRVEDITEALWGTRVPPSAVSELNQQLYERIEAWRNQPITGRFAYVALDGVWLKRSWGGEVKNVAVLVAIGVDQDGYRQVLGVSCQSALQAGSPALLMKPSGPLPCTGEVVSLQRCEKCWRAARH